jgi:hypothetical protein
MEIDSRSLDHGSNPARENVEKENDRCAEILALLPSRASIGAGDLCLTSPPGKKQSEIYVPQLAVSSFKMLPYN